MRRIVLAAALCAVATAVTQAAPTVSPRIERVEGWLKAVLKHEPGSGDEALAAVAAWPASSVQALWVDVRNLAAMMRNPSIVRFDIRQPRQRASQQIRYSPNDMRRLRLLACVAAGIMRHRDCAGIKTAEIDADLVRLAELAGESAEHGDVNYVLRRGALLHTDIAMAAPAAIEPIEPPGLPGPQRLRISLDDGLGKDLGQSAVHWEVARMLLDQVQPAGSDRADPGRDGMVLQWYRATAAWMQSRESYETLHLDRAREIFPDDPDIAFLNGTLHETYAAPRIQNAVHSVSLPTGTIFDIESDHGELRRAEAALRRAVALKPDSGDAHLHLGRVLVMLGRPGDAVKELTRAVEATDDELLSYYGALFLGASHEALGHFAAAHDSFARAAELRPRAQSPHLALSALARRRGDRSGARREIRRVFELASGDDNDDPWWSYHTAQARNADDLIAALLAPFASGSDR